MAAVIYLDTHVLVWLYSSGRDGVPTDVANILARIIHKKGRPSFNPLI